MLAQLKTKTKENKKMSNVVKQKDGRRWSIDSSGIKSLKRKYQVIQDAIAGENGEAVSFDGVPAIGTVHPSYPYLFAESYDVEEGEGSAKRVLIVNVNYASHVIETSGSGSSAATSQVEEWGWDSGTEEREFVDSIDNFPILNSAGDVFDRVPSISVRAPTFTKVVRWKYRKDDAMGYNCKINQSSVTIGGVDYPARSLMCAVAEKRIIGDPDWKYRYTIQLKFRTNLVRVAGSNTPTDIGWDVAIVDAGMREKDDTTGKLKLIKAVDPETGKRCAVTSPELLNGSGKAVVRSSSVTPKPYVRRFRAYASVDFPSWFYSEP